MEAANVLELQGCDMFRGGMDPPLFVPRTVTSCGLLDEKDSVSTHTYATPRMAQGYRMYPPGHIVFNLCGVSAAHHKRQDGVKYTLTTEKAFAVGPSLNCRVLLERERGGRGVERRRGRCSWTADGGGR